MKKIINFALAGVLGTTALVSAIGALIPNYCDETATLNASASKTGNTLLAITEISADPMQIEFASLNTASPDAVVRDTSDVFEFVEIHNYGENAVNLNDYAFVHTVGTKTYQNELKFEDGNDGIVESGETWIIFNYTTSSASYGSVSGTTYSMRHDTAEDLAAAWATFNEFYGISVPVENRVMAIAADSDGKAITGSSALANSGDCSVQLVKKSDSTVMSKINYTMATKDAGQNFVYTDDSGVGELLCVNPVSPYRLLREQDPAWSRDYDFSGEKLRIASYNLLFNGRAFTARASCFADFLNTYSPDVVALQEIATDWYFYLHQVLPSLGYTYVEVKVQTGSENGATVPTYSSDSSNPFIYKTDKFDLVEYDTRFISKNHLPENSGWDSVNRMRMVNYATFKSKATGNVFNVLSTHGVLTGDKAKLLHGDVAMALANEVSAKNDNCPTFVAGDWNMDEGSKYYQNLVNGTGYENSRYTAKYTTYRFTTSGFGHHPYGTTNKEQAWSEEASVIDHILVNEGTQIKYYMVIDQAYYNLESATEYPTRDCRISDHSAVLIEAYI